MALSTLELDEVVDLVKAEIRRLYPSANIADYTDWAREAEILARLFLGNQQQALYALRSRFALTCPDEELDALAASYGTRRQEETKFSGKVIALSTDAGVPETIPVGLVARAEDGTEYVVTATATTARTTFSPALSAAEGSSRSRIVVAPGVTQLSEGEVFFTQGGYDNDDSWHTVRDVLSSTAAVEVWPALRADLTVGESLVAVWGCVVDIEAVEAGASGMRAPWERLTWDPTTKPGDLDDEAIVCLLSGGGDVETNDELRSRLVALESGARGVGTSMDYVRWATSTPNLRVAAAFCYPNYVSQGVMTVVCLGVSGARELGTEALARIESHIESLMPSAGVALDVRGASYSTEVDVSVLVTPRVGSEPDWTTGSNPSRFEVDAASTTTVVNVTTDPTATIEVGDRVLITTEVDSRKKTVQRTVTATTATSITLDEPLEILPVAGTYVYSGGPIAQDVIDAIEALFDNLGPGVYGSGGTVEFLRVPDPTVANAGSLRNAAITAAVFAVPGVEDVSNVEVDGVSGDDAFATVLTAFRAGTIIIDWEV